MPLGLQKGTHVLRNPKLLESLVQPPPLGAEQAAGSQEPVLQRDMPEEQARFKALMSRLQADIVEASEQDTISSPQADLMRSVIGTPPVPSETVSIWSSSLDRQPLAAKSRVDSEIVHRCPVSQACAIHLLQGALP